MKRCSLCKETKADEDFYYAGKIKSRLSSWCKACTKSRVKVYAKRVPEKVKDRARKSQMKRMYGISLEQYDELLQRQGGCCAVCGRPATDFSKRLAIDHDHATGEIRGLLCDYDNRFTIGRHRKGNGGHELLRYAGEYLGQENYTGWFVPEGKRKIKRRRKKRG